MMIAVWILAIAFAVMMLMLPNGLYALLYTAMIFLFGYMAGRFGVHT